MAVNDVIQVVFGCRYGEQLGLNVRHYLSTAVVGSGVSYGSVAAAFFNSFGVLYSSALSASATFRGTAVQRIHPLPPTMPVVHAPGDVPGLITGDPLPRQVAGLISLRTASAGRAFRGRVYVPFPSETANDVDSTPTVTYLGVLNALALGFVTPQTVVDGGNSETFTPVIWHRETRTFTLITMAFVNDAWATQRRRGSFGRPNVLIGADVPIVPVGP